VEEEARTAPPTCGRDGTARDELFVSLVIVSAPARFGSIRGVDEEVGVRL
jgi:hypothetical protein